MMIMCSSMWSNAIFQLPQIRKGVLIGDIRDMRSLFLMVLAKSIIVVDDGMASLSLHKDHSDFEWVRYWFKRLILKWVWNCRFKDYCSFNPYFRRNSSCEN